MVYRRRSNNIEQDSFSSIIIWLDCISSTSLTKTHGKIRTAKVIYDALLNIILSLKNASEPILQTHFDSEIEQQLQLAWEDQRKIG